MTIRVNGALNRCLAGSALGGIIAFAFVPQAEAQRLPPWSAPFPGEIVQSLEAQGYVLTAPLMRRPGIYLADVSAGPADYERLIIDARSGWILERFTAPGRFQGPALASRGDAFGERLPPGIGGPPLSGGFPGGPAPAPAAKSTHGGSANIHIPAAISPYDTRDAPASGAPKPKSASSAHKPKASMPAAPTINPPLPPPAPRETAKAEESGGAGPSSSVDTNDRAKVSIVPPALFE